MLAMPVMRPTSYAPGPDPGHLSVTYEAGPSPRELLENVVLQANAALKSLTAMSRATTVNQDAEGNQPTKEQEERADVEQEVALRILW